MPPRRSLWPLITIGLITAAILVAGIVLLVGGGDDSEPDLADPATVRFEGPADKGPDPFTKAADVRGGDRVEVGSGPFRGAGSDLVCDRELLIRSLRARPEGVREWARVLTVGAGMTAVARYVRGLRSMTLTSDARVTNHSFTDGRAVRFQSILQAGTAVLVDDKGFPVVRCRSGSPLRNPVFIKSGRCLGCPASYKLPPDCMYVDFSRLYRGHEGDEFLRVYRRRDFRHACYRPHPDPPEVRRGAAG